MRKLTAILSAILILSSSWPAAVVRAADRVDVVPLQEKDGKIRFYYNVTDANLRSGPQAFIRIRQVSDGRVFGDYYPNKDSKGGFIIQKGMTEAEKIGVEQGFPMALTDLQRTEKSSAPAGGGSQSAVATAAGGKSAKKRKAADTGKRAEAAPASPAAASDHGSESLIAAIRGNFSEVVEQSVGEYVVRKEEVKRKAADPNADKDLELLRVNPQAWKNQWQAKIFDASVALARGKDQMAGRHAALKKLNPGDMQAYLVGKCMTVAPSASSGGGSETSAKGTLMQMSGQDADTAGKSMEGGSASASVLVDKCNTFMAEEKKQNALKSTANVKEIGFKSGNVPTLTAGSGGGSGSGSGGTKERCDTSKNPHCSDQDSPSVKGDAKKGAIDAGAGLAVLGGAAALMALGGPAGIAVGALALLVGAYLVGSHSDGIKSDLSAFGSSVAGAFKSFGNWLSGGGQSGQVSGDNM